MTLPTFLLGVVISSLYGAVYHLVRGGSGKRLLAYLVAGWVGFWIGHLVGQVFGITFFSVGALRLGAATIFALLALFLANWLAIETSSPKV
jgi:uncharacterized membrane protein YeaQ/YmgE (transglycosylase-associated protein family)